MSWLDNKSAGIIETKNFVTTVIACDVMVKAAHVSLHSVYKIGGARTCMIIVGDLASCQAAIAAVKHMTGVECTILARPAEELQLAIEEYLFTRNILMNPPPPGHEAQAAKKTENLP